VAVNCGAVPETLIESELFGHEKGAFTGAVNRKPGLFEIADRGVLFLDEIGEVSHAIQVRLLRVLETQEFLRVGATRPTRSDVRVVCASNKDLKSEMGAGRFRDDLYYRLNGVTLKLPALRERKGDVALLARHFVERFAPSKRLSPGAVLALESYPWPGNVRELQMVIQRAALLAHGETLEPADFPLEVRHVEAGGPEMDYSPDLSLAEVERRHIETVLQRHQGHRGRTARALGIDPKTLYNKLGPERTRTRKDAS
jgi:two-component system response regulator HydG